MDTGSYKLVCEHAGLQGRAEMPGHLFFVLVDGAKPTDQETKLKRDVETTATACRKFLQTSAPKRFRERFDALLSLAQVGLLAPTANPVEASSTLENLKEDMVLIEGQEIRTRYLWNLLKLAVLFCCLFLIIFFVAVPVSRFLYANVFGTNGEEADSKNVQSIAQAIHSYSLMLLTAMVGLWVSFALRRNFKFDELFLPENDLLSPLHRVLFVICATSILALFCSLNFVGVSIATFETKALPQSLAVAATFGVLCGLSQNLLPDMILPRTEQFAGWLRETRKNGQK